MHPNQPSQSATESSGPPGTVEPTTAYPLIAQTAPAHAAPAQGAPGRAVPHHPVAAPPGALPPGLRMSLGDALTGGGALLVFLFSFTPFIGYDDADLIERLEEENLPTWFSAWALETFLAPLTWWVIFAALGLVAVVALRFRVPKDREFAGFRFSHLQVGLSLFAFFVLLGYALSAKTLLFGSELQDESMTDGDVSLSWGGYLMLVCALAAAAGAVIDHLGVGPTVWPAPPRPTQVGAAYPGHSAHPQAYPQNTQGYPQTQAGYPQPQAGYPQPHAGYSPGQASVPPNAQHGGYPPNQQLPNQ